MSAPQPSQESILQTLMEENNTLIDNKRFLIAHIKDLSKRIEELESVETQEADQVATVEPIKAAPRRKR